MVHWRDPLVEALCGYVFALLTIFTFGFYAWYLILTLDRVELPLLRRKMKFRFMHIPYLFGRFCHLAAMISGVVATTELRPLVDCRGLTTLAITAGLGNVALVAASTNLALRAFIMWKDTPPVQMAIAITFTAHFTIAITLSTKAVGAQWNPILHFCAYKFTNVQRLLVTFYAFTLTWDVVILALTIVGMRRQKLPPRSTLWTALLGQGFTYLVITCVTCIPMMIMAMLNLNESLSVMMAAPGGTLSVITSSAFVTSLRETVGEPVSTSEPTSDAEDSHLAEPRDGGGHALTTHIELSTVDSSATMDGRYSVRDGRRFWVEDH